MLRMTTDLGWHSALGSLRSRRITLFLELEIVPVSGRSMCLYVSVSTVWFYVYFSLFNAETSAIVVCISLSVSQYLES